MAKAMEVALLGSEIAEGEWLNLVLVMTQVANGLFDEAEAEIDTRFQSEVYALVARVFHAAALGDAERTEELYQKLMVATNEDGFWRLLGVFWKGDRDESNRLAAQVDQHPFGPVALALLTYWCACGGPWDIEVTPNFANTVSETGLSWPPPSPINFPLRDW